MSKLLRLPSRRRLLILAGVLSLLVGLALLHPFMRQSVFGPTIEGIPWCVWENEVRSQAEANWQPSWVFRVFEKMGLIRRNDGTVDLATEAALPVFLHLAEDDHVPVRRFALERLSWRVWPGRGDEILPIVQRHVDDADPICRVYAVAGVWRGKKDPALRRKLLPLLDHQDEEVQTTAVATLCLMAPHVPETFEPLARMCETGNPSNRMTAYLSMHVFGAKALPVLRKGLGDSDAHVRRFVLIAVTRLGKAAKDLEPALVAMQNERDVRMHSAVHEALSAIDPVRYPPAAKEDD